MKKKYSASSKDKKDWVNFTKQIGNIGVKEDDLLEENQQINKVRKIDLHGYSLNNANKVVKKFIIESFNQNYKKLLIVTGKGSRSKSYDDPYISESLSVLKNSVPEYINSNLSLSKHIVSISEADKKNGADGAIIIKLKKL